MAEANENQSSLMSAVAFYRATASLSAEIINDQEAMLTDLINLQGRALTHDMKANLTILAQKVKGWKIVEKTADKFARQQLRRSGVSGDEVETLTATASLTLEESAVDKLKKEASEEKHDKRKSTKDKGVKSLVPTTPKEVSAEHRVSKRRSGARPEPKAELVRFLGSSSGVTIS